MNVLLTKSFFQEDIAYISKYLENGINLIIPKDFNEESLVEYASEADVFLGGLITEKLLKAAKNLKFIQIPWTGVDNLDFELLQKFNITICNSHSNSTVVAEHAIALMMDAAKKISYHDRLMRQGKWNRVKPDLSNSINPFSNLIHGSKIAIIGFGAIGEKIYKLLKGFSCNFKIFSKDKIVLDEQDNQISIYSSDKIQMELFDIDFVFTCVPLTNETFGLINSSFLSGMKKEAILINISRGEVMNEEDIYNALNNNSIAFAAIDTWFNYPSKDSPDVFPSKRFAFHLLDNLILSPHRAGYISGSFPHLNDAIENLNRYKLGNKLINIVSLKNKY